MVVTVQGGVLCCMGWLNQLLAVSETAGHPITDFITRPLTRNKADFQEKGLSSADVSNRMKHHFTAVGVYNGQTVHGSRSGAMQHDVHMLGLSKEQAGQAAQIRTPAIVDRYPDRFRHCKK